MERPFGSTGILPAATSSPAPAARLSPETSTASSRRCPTCNPPNLCRWAPQPTRRCFASCRQDFTRAIDLIPENEQITGLLRGTSPSTPDHSLSAEYLRSNNKAIARVAPAPTSHLMQATSPFYPVGAPTRDLDPLLPFFGLPDPTPGGPTLGGAANWRQVPAGPRTSGDDTTTDRFMVNLEGTFSGFDYRSGDRPFQEQERGFRQARLRQRRDDAARRLGRHHQSVR